MIHQDKIKPLEPLFNQIKDKQPLFHISAEVAPYSKKGGLGDVVGSLPSYLNDENFVNITISPHYSQLTSDPVHLSTEILFFNGLEVNYSLYYCIDHQTTHLFIKTDEIFCFDDVYLEDGILPYGKSITINYFVFGKIVATFLHKYFNDFKLITHDWHVSAVYLYLVLHQDTHYDSFHLIHNYHYHGSFFHDILDYLESEIQPPLRNIFHEYGYCSFSMIALLFTSNILTVSPSYARELMTGHAPHTELGPLRGKKITGIMNGIHTDVWSPQRDTFIPFKYDEHSIHLKENNKKYLMKKYDLDPQLNTPIVLMLSRLTVQKGIDLFIDLNIGCSIDPNEKIKQLLSLGLTLIICGTPQGGEGGPIDLQFKALENKFSPFFRYINIYTEEVAHELLAGCDILLHPSRFEPCGLTQMYALQYGTIPIVTPVGGLKDSIKDLLTDPLTGFGYMMDGYSYEALLACLGSSIRDYKEKDLWYRIIKRAMLQNNQWVMRIPQYKEVLQLYYVKNQRNTS